MVLYLVTVRLQEMSGGPMASATHRIRVVRGTVTTPPQVTVEGVVFREEPWILRALSSCGTVWSTPKTFEVPLSLESRHLSPIPGQPELSVTLLNGSAFKPGDHLKYRMKLLGEGPHGTSKILSRVDGLRIWIRRVRWVSDGGGREASANEVAKPPQTVDFSSGAGGVLPVDFDGSLTIPLGIAPTVRGSLLTNEFDFVVEVLKGARSRGQVEVPITLYRDLENTTSNFASPTMRPTPYKVNSAVHHGDGTEGSEADDPAEEMGELMLT